GVTIAPSLPILLAAAMLFQPATVGVLALVGSTDLREARRQIGIGHALFNRSQIAISVVTASWIFHALGGDLNAWPRVLILAMLVLSVDILVNASLVLFARQVAIAAPFRELVTGLLGGRYVSFSLWFVSFFL